MQHFVLKKKDDATVKMHAMMALHGSKEANQSTKILCIRCKQTKVLKGLRSLETPVCGR
jgi:hypothetical protein